MKKIALIAGLMFCTTLFYWCAPNEMRGYRHHWSIPACKCTQNQVNPLPDCNYPASAMGTTCIDYLPAFDVAGWWETNMNSRAIRDRQVFSIGCFECGEGCDTSQQTGCNTARFKFDFTKLVDDAEVYSAKLAVKVMGNQDLMSHSVLKGRVNVGGDFAVISGPPEMCGCWALFDITSFACRAVMERRNSATLELGLDCNCQKTTSRIMKVPVVLYDVKNETYTNQPPVIKGRPNIGNAPRIIFEYR